MKHSSDYAGLLSDVAFEMYVRIRRYVNMSFTWLCEAWVGTWKAVFSILSWIASLLLNRQVWAITVLVGVVWVAIAGPPLLARVVKIDEWQMTDCDFMGVHVFVSAPKSIAPGDQRYLEITVQNETDTTVGNVRVSVKSPDGLLLFDETNTVMIETLGRSEASTEVLDFRVVNLRALEEVSTIVMYSTEGEGNQLRIQPCSETPTLVNSAWRRMIVRLKAAPSVLDAGATYIGYLSTLITGTLAITGNFGPVVRGIVSVLRPSSSEVGGQSNQQSQRDDTTYAAGSGSQAPGCVPKYPEL